MENRSLSVEYHLNQSHDTSMWPSCDSFCFDQLTRSMEGEGELGYKKRRSSGYKHFGTSQLSSLVWKSWDVQIWTFDIFVHLKTLILFVQRMFCNGKKNNYINGNSLKMGVGQQNIVLHFFLVLIVIVYACLSREGDMFFLKWKRRNWTYDSNPQRLEASCWLYWDEWPLLCTAWLCWLVGPDPILSVALCTSSYF